MIRISGCLIVSVLLGCTIKQKEKEEERQQHKKLNRSIVYIANKKNAIQID